MFRFDARSVFSPTVLLALALMTVIVMMILPMPAWVLDVGLAASFALAILIGDEIRRIFVRRGNRFVLRWLTW